MAVRHTELLTKYRNKKDVFEALCRHWAQFIDDVRSNNGVTCCELEAVEEDDTDETFTATFDLPGAWGYVELTWDGAKDEGSLVYGFIRRGPSRNDRLFEPFCHVPFDVDGCVHDNLCISTGGGGYAVHLAAVGQLIKAIKPGGSRLPLSDVVFGGR